MAYEIMVCAEDGPIGWLTLNRPRDGNTFNATMCQAFAERRKSDADSFGHWRRKPLR